MRPDHRRHLTFKADELVGGKNSDLRVKRYSQAD